MILATIGLGIVGGVLILGTYVLTFLGGTLSSLNISIGISGAAVGGALGCIMAWVNRQGRPSGCLWSGVLPLLLALIASCLSFVAVLFWDSSGPQSPEFEIGIAVAILIGVMWSPLWTVLAVALWALPSIKAGFRRRHPDV